MIVVFAFQFDGLVHQPPVMEEMNESIECERSEFLQLERSYLLASILPLDRDT
jgi:hypothetical protein